MPYRNASQSSLALLVNRYYSNAYGRFMTPDPASGAHPSNPQTWNRYAYTGGDPVNRIDPSGMDYVDPAACTGDPGLDKNQQLTYQYDAYNRLTSVTWANNPRGADVLRTYYYDTNPLLSGFSQNSLGRLTAVQYPDPLDFFPGADPVQLVDMYSYTQAGLPATKRLQVNESLHYQDTHGYGHNTSGTANLDSTYTYNSEGKITSITYPTTTNDAFLNFPGNSFNGSSDALGTYPGASYNYSYDGMYRLSGMTSGSTTVVNGVSYNPANQLLGITYNGVNETRGYNVLDQLTNITAGTSENLTYTYPAGANNGKLSSMYNAISGETVTYTYDSLNRLATANGSGWGEQYGFDPFGNLTTKQVTSGSGPSLSQTVNTANNRITGGSYDGNGNTTSVFNNGFTYGLIYDAENRVAAASYSAGYLDYAYDAQNRRIWSWPGSTDIYGQGNPNAYLVTLYSPAGQKLGTYQINVVNTVNSGYSTVSTLMTSDQYFGGRRLAVMDQLGSVVKNSGSQVQGYYPWGEPKGTVNPQDTWNFATYWADSFTSLDYANNRYYSNSYGRFMTPDPYHASGAPSDAQSWNRYAYTAGDPVNRLDPNGLDYTIPCDGDDENCGGVVDINQNACITIDNAPNPFCGYPIYGFQGNGGGASGTKLGIAHRPGSNVGPAGYSGAIALLQNPSANCLKDLNAASANAASTTLQGATIDYTLGVWPTVDANGNVVSGTPAQSYSPKSGNFIDINLNFGWLTPTNVLINGPNGPFYENYLADVGQSIGEPSITNTQYWELVLLHELGHLLGVPQEPPGGAYNTAIFNDCIKGH